MTVKWVKSMATGNKVVDKQHKEFLTYLGGLSKKLETSVDLGDVRIAIDRLSRYINTHFVYEEKLIEKDELARHKKEHKKVQMYFKEFKMEFMEVYTKPNLSSQKLKEILKKLVDTLASNYVGHMLTAKELHKKR